MRALAARRCASCVGLRAQRPGGDNHPRGQACGRRLKRLTVATRDRPTGRVDEVGKCVRQTELSRPDAALRRRPEKPRRGAIGTARQGGEPAEPVLRRQRVVEVGEELGELLRKVVRRTCRRSRCSANAVSGSVPAARPSPRSIRSGKMPLSMLKVSATLSGL